MFCAITMGETAVDEHVLMAACFHKTVIINADENFLITALILILDVLTAHMVLVKEWIIV